MNYGSAWEFKKNTIPILLSGALLVPCTFSAAAETMHLRINQHSFTLLVPKTTQQIDQGLMYRRQLAPRSGMYFAIESEEINTVSMWMKNTYIPLDILFIDPKNRIACIRENAQPRSLKLISCPYPTVAVIEINAGEAKKYRLVKGMKIVKE